MQETTRERRLKEIAQLKAKLQKKEAQLNSSARKERNGKLIAFGILVEEILKSGDTQTISLLKEKATQHLKDRNLDRVMKRFETSL